MWTIPGTVLNHHPEDIGQIDSLISGLFLAGDLQLGQVSAISGIPGYMIQNWVKRGFLSPPREKKYSINQLCRILCINSLRRSLTMEQITHLLESINGKMDDESDDRIPDSLLYCLFVQYACQCQSVSDIMQRNILLDSLLCKASIVDVPNLKDVLNIMLDAWIAAVYQSRATQSLLLLQGGNKHG